jgi:hypothetical protein
MAVSSSSSVEGRDEAEVGEGREEVGPKGSDVANRGRGDEVLPMQKNGVMESDLGCREEGRCILTSSQKDR